MQTITKELKDSLVFGEYTTEMRKDFHVIFDPTGAIVGYTKVEEYIEPIIRGIRRRYSKVKV